MKKRCIRPGFFKNYPLYSAELESKLPLRLAYLGLLTICDDSGHFPWVPEEIKLQVIPFDKEVDFTQVLEKLESMGYVRRNSGSKGGKGYVKRGMGVINKRMAHFDLLNNLDYQ